MKKILTFVSLAVILVFGLLAAFNAYNTFEPSYDDPDINVLDIYNNPGKYIDNGDDAQVDSVTGKADGIADIIVKANLDNAYAANDVASIVFDFRGFDTLGESFILLTAIAGSFVILSRSHKKKEDSHEV